jgi:threonyl-tRNA synthetase
MPDRFDLTYIGQDGSKKRAFVVHRSSLGSIERMMAFLIEKYGGAFPLWLSPVQAIVLPISDKQQEYAEQIHKALRSKNIRVEIDNSNESLGKKIREAKLQKIPYLVVVGSKEQEGKVLTVEQREGEKLSDISLEDFLSRLKKEIEERT